MQAASASTSRASQTSQFKDQATLGRWSVAYQLSLQFSEVTPPPFRRVVRSRGGIFHHEPLHGLRPLIRLIYLLPQLSPEGLIRCIIFHAPIESSYACLSYEWTRALHLRSDRHAGVDERVILVNERPFLIRENLFDFLRTARHNAIRNWRLSKIDLSTPFWIDAISIDQSNPPEKNHQVKRMGHIYSQATTVHTWLGIAVPPTQGTGLLRGQQPSAIDYGQQLEAAMEHWLNDQPLPEHSLEEHVLYHITQNTYWSRAWVVQEICLAQELVVWVHTVPVDSKTIRFVQSGFFWNMGEHDHFDHYRSTNFRKPARTSLLTTLDQFKNKECADPRDRIYSLLSLCSEGASSIPVDYTISLDQLAYHVLRSHSGPLCFCLALRLARQLELSPGCEDVEDSTGVNGLDTPWIEVDVPLSTIEHDIAFPESLDRSPICEAFRPIFRSISRSYVTGSWLDSKVRHRMCEANEKTDTVRIALNALGRLDGLHSTVALCRTAFSIAASTDTVVRLGRGA